MDASDAVIQFIVLAATGFGLGYLSETLFDSSTPNAPLKLIIAYYFVLSLVLIALHFVPQAFIRRPGTLRWYYRFRSSDEAFELIRLAVCWWLVVFNFFIGMEVFAFGLQALPFILDLRQDHCDDPDYIPVLMRLNWTNISWMVGLIGKMGIEMGRLALWHIQSYWAELKDYLEQLLRRRFAKDEL